MSAPSPSCRAEVTLDGTRTAYWVYGEHHDNGERVLVALHGLRGTHHGLLPVVARLEGIRVVVPDLPGFGESAPLEVGAHDVAGYAAWARHFVTAVAPEAVLLGHSFGSVVAAAAVSVGLPVRALVLVNPIAARALAGPRTASRTATVRYHRLAGVLPERTGMALLRSRIITRMASGAMVTTPDPALRAWIHAEHDRHFNRFADRRVLLEAFSAAVAHDVGEYAAAVSAPTLLLAGALDDIAPLAAQHRLAARFADARLVVIAGTGHLAHYEAPASIARAITAFVAEVRA